MPNIRITAFAALVLTAAVACGLSSRAGTPQAGGEGPVTPTPTEAPMIPISINEGLASLDSYRMTYTTDVSDSSSGERTVSTFVVANDRAADASYSRNETQVLTIDGELVSDDAEEQIVIGDQMCSVSLDGAEAAPFPETAQVMADLVSRVIEFKPLIEDPVYLADDIVNGVPVRRYTFELSSIGAASDLEASRSEGSYAIAIDGDYLVQYLLDLELRSAAEGDPEAQVSTFSIGLSLEAINQPVEISFPAECLTADTSGE
jgi:hypothetical protein